MHTFVFCVCIVFTFCRLTMAEGGPTDDLLKGQNTLVASQEKLLVDEQVSDSEDYKLPAPGQDPLAGLSEEELKALDEDAEQVLDVLKNMSDNSRRRTLQLMQPLLQPLMSSTLTVDGDLHLRQVNDKASVIGDAGQDDEAEPVAPPGGGQPTVDATSQSPVSASDSRPTITQPEVGNTQHSTSVSSAAPRACNIADISQQQRLSTSAVRQMSSGSEVTLNMTGATSKLIVQTAPPPPYHKLRTFSGKDPMPAGQVDYDTWRMSANKLVEDEDVPVKQKLQKLQEGLAKPALEIVESALNGKDPKAVIVLLDQVYGCVSDGRTLLKQFYADEQGDEKASVFLSRLHIQLQKLMKKGVVSIADSTSELFQQFVAGCHDDNMLLKLRLDASSPPVEYGTLLSSIRLEEARRTHKALTKKVARSNQVEAVTEIEQLRKEVATLRSKNEAPRRRNLEQEVEELRQELAAVKQQQARPTAQMSTSSNPAPSRTPQRPQKKLVFRKFCFKCGLFDHMMGRCTNAANPQLVMQRWAEREQQKQSN